jgi:hypothetical protein
MAKNGSRKISKKNTKSMSGFKTCPVAEKRDRSPENYSEKCVQLLLAESSKPGNSMG